MTSWIGKDVHEEFERILDSVESLDFSKHLMKRRFLILAVLKEGPRVIIL